MYKRSRKKRLIRLIFLLFFLFFTATIVSFFLFGGSHEVLSIKSPLSTTFSKEEAISPTPTDIPLPENSPGLSAAVADALNGTHGTYGIVIKNLATGESYYQHEKDTFESGSLYKLWLMAVVFQQIQQGTLHPSDILSKDVMALSNEFGVDPDPNEQTSGTLTLSVADALTQSITISSNNASLLLTDKVSVPEISKFLATQGFTHSRVGQKNKPPTTTARDIALFFEKLYKGQLANEDSTEKMLSLLKEQRLNDKLPKYLPGGVVIAHKTGELDSVTHDAGIVYGPSGDYIIVVLSESDSPDLAKERISLVSKAVYNYFASLTSPTSSN